MEVRLPFQLWVAKGMMQALLGRGGGQKEQPFVLYCIASLPKNSVLED